MMKRKQMAMVFGMMMVLATGCAGGKQEAVTTTSSAVISSEAAQTEENVIGMPNPYTDHISLEEAEKAAGFQIQIPEEIGGEKAKVFRNKGTEMLEVIYEKEDQEVARVRKGIGAGDISGDYHTYAEVNTVEIDGRSVTIKGDKGQYALAVWEERDYTYSLSVEAGLSQEELTGLVEQVQ